MKGPILVILAAGAGSRYGGLKQMDRLGKNGEVLLDYSVFDAVRSGFEKIVFIIRKDIEADFREIILNRMCSKVRWEFAYQETDKLIPANIFAGAQKAGRIKPWGTAHALLCAADKIDGPFAVINADDFYGREAFAVMGKHLSGPDANESAILPYRLDKTLSDQGTVSRGVCNIENGYLVSVDELTTIGRTPSLEDAGSIINTFPDGTVCELTPDSPVSMNFWGFPPTVIPEIQKYFDGFLTNFAADIPGQIKSECYLPLVADWLIKQGIIKIKVLKADSEWFGVTYREDRETAIKKLSDMTAAGIYPPSLW